MAAIDDLLQAAAALVSTEAAWCKRAAARKTNGLPCSPLYSGAVAWDLHGSLIRAANNLNFGNSVLHQGYQHLRGKIPPSRRNKDIDSFNDSLIFADVAALYT